MGKRHVPKQEGQKAILKHKTTDLPCIYYKGSRDQYLKSLDSSAFSNETHSYLHTAQFQQNMG